MDFKKAKVIAEKTVKQAVGMSGQCDCACEANTDCACEAYGDSTCEVYSDCACATVD